MPISVSQDERISRPDIVGLLGWEPFQQCLSKQLSELTDGQIDREERFWFDTTRVNAMNAVVETEAVTAAPELREWLI